MDILVIENSEERRNEMTSLLRAAGMTILASCAGARELQLPRTHTPHLAVVGIEDNVISAQNTLAAIKNFAPQALILVVADADNCDLVVNMVHAGANGYLTRDQVQLCLATAADDVGHGRVFLSERILGSILKYLRATPLPPVQSDPPSRLTTRERDVLEQMSRGHDVATIANTLCISRHTLNTHIKRIYAKLGVKSRSEAVYLAMSEGLIRFIPSDPR